MYWKREWASICVYMRILFIWNYSECVCVLARQATDNRESACLYLVRPSKWLLRLLGGSGCRRRSNTGARRRRRSKPGGNHPLATPKATPQRGWSGSRSTASPPRDFAGPVCPFDPQQYRCVGGDVAGCPPTHPRATHNLRIEVKCHLRPVDTYPARYRPLALARGSLVNTTATPSGMSRKILGGHARTIGEFEFEKSTYEISNQRVSETLGRVAQICNIGDCVKAIYNI